MGTLSDMVLNKSAPNINVLGCPVKFTEDIFEYCESSDFLGLTLKKKQREILEKFYSKDETGEDRFNVLVCVVGMRSGKSALGSFIGGFGLQHLLSFDSPQQHFGLIPGDDIFIVNTANSENQSQETIFQKMQGQFKKISFWKKYLSWLKERELKERNLRRYDLLSEAGTYYKFKHQDVIVKAEHSNSASIAGKNVYHYLSDEICRSDTAEEEVQSKTQKRSAQAVFNTLQRGTQTFGMEGKTFIGSSPMFEDDYGMQLLYGCSEVYAGKNKELLDNLIIHYEKPKVPTYIGFYYESKEFNPKLTEKTLNSEFIRSPTTFDRDYKAIPPKTESPFIKDPSLIDAAMLDKEELVIFRDIDIVDTVKGETRTYIGKEMIGIKPEKLIPRWICCDQGESDCAFVIGMAHGEKRIVDYMGVKEERTISCIDLIIPYFPSEKKRVSFTNVVDVIKLLNKWYSIKKVTYDRWQSTSDLQRLFASGIKTEVLGATKEMYDAFYNDLFVGLIEIINVERVSDQLKKLKEVKGKICGQKDIADAIVRMNYMIRRKESQEVQNSVMTEPRKASFAKTRKMLQVQPGSGGFNRVPADAIWDMEGTKEWWGPLGGGR